MTQSWDNSFKNNSYVAGFDFAEKIINTYSDWFGERNILDAGCGIGTHTIPLAGMNLNVTALDKSDFALKELEKKISNEPYEERIIPVNGSLDNIQFNDDYFDIVLSTSTIHHGTYEQRDKWLGELTRVNKKHGLIVLSVLSRDDVRYGTGKQIEADTFIGISDTFDADVPHHFYSVDELIENLEKREYGIHKCHELDEIIDSNHGTFKHLYIIASKQHEINVPRYLVRP